jgi:hypothetical protein
MPCDARSRTQTRTKETRRALEILERFSGRANLNNMGNKKITMEQIAKGNVKDLQERVKRADEKIKKVLSDEELSIGAVPSFAQIEGTAAFALTANVHLYDARGAKKTNLEASA